MSGSHAGSVAEVVSFVIWGDNIKIKTQDSKPALLHDSHLLLAAALNNSNVCILQIILILSKLLHISFKYN